MLNTTKELAEVISRYKEQADATYDSVLRELGSVNLDKPSAIYLYASDFEKKEEKEKKYVTRKEFRICFVILLVAIGFATFSINDSIRQSRNETSNAIYMMEERFNNRIDSIPRNIEQGIADANNPISEGYMEMVHVDYEAKTATLSLTIVP